VKIDLFEAEGLKLVTLKSYPDSRGFFTERYKQSAFEELGLPTNLVQDNFSRSHHNVLRGLHFQWNPPQGKLVTCLRGWIFDVAVDLRVLSSTFGKVTTVELDGDRPQWFWIPAGFAHGFCVLSNEGADVLYQCDREYQPQGESGICWNDKELNIQWPLQNPLVSVRDAEMGSFADFQQRPQFQEAWR